MAWRIPTAAVTFLMSLVHVSRSPRLRNQASQAELEGLREVLPSALAKSSRDIGSSLGGSSWTATLGANLPDIFFSVFFSLRTVRCEAKRAWKERRVSCSLMSRSAFVIHCFSTSAPNCGARTTSHPDSPACRHGERFPAFKLHLHVLSSRLDSAATAWVLNSAATANVNICNCLAAAGWG